MGKREELTVKLYKYAFDKYPSPADQNTFMLAVQATIAEFVFDDEKTPLDVSIEPVKTKWFSPYQAPQNNTPVLAKYTDGEEPVHEVLEFVDGEWWDPNEVRRPFVWTRIPE